MNILKIVSFFNVKGGVGKTTLTILTAIKLSKQGNKILIIRQTRIDDELDKNESSENDRCRLGHADAYCLQRYF